MNFNDNDEPLSTEERRELFRKTALERYTSLEQLDEMLRIVNTRKWIGLICMGMIAFIVLIWALYGSLPLKVEGRGLLVHSKGFFNVETKVKGTVEELHVKAGDLVTHGQLLLQLSDPVEELRIKTLQLKIHSTEQKIAEAKTADPNRTLELAQDKEQLALLQENAQLYQIKSPYSGKILELLVNPGDFLEPGKPVAWMEHIESADDPLVVYSFFPLERGKKLKKGDSIDIELSTVNSNEFGALQGHLQSISQFAISKESVEHLIQNKALADYLTPDSQAALSAIILLAKDPSTPSGYKWTSVKGPPSKITSGTPATLKATIERVRPIYYLLPLYKFKYTSDNPSSDP